MAKSPSQPRAFSFAERVAYQRAIEDVDWRHRIWPKENPDPKPSLDAVMSQAQLEKKVTDYLRNAGLPPVVSTCPPDETVTQQCGLTAE
jgi:hypothetical protein